MAKTQDVRDKACEAAQVRQKLQFRKPFNIAARKLSNRVVVKQILSEPHGEPKLAAESCQLPDSVFC